MDTTHVYAGSSSGEPPVEPTGIQQVAPAAAEPAPAAAEPAGTQQPADVFNRFVREIASRQMPETVDGSEEGRSRQTPATTEMSTQTANARPPVIEDPRPAGPQPKSPPPVPVLSHPPGLEPPGSAAVGHLLTVPELMAARRVAGRGPPPFAPAILMDSRNREVLKEFVAACKAEEGPSESDVRL